MEQESNKTKDRMAQARQYLLWLLARREYPRSKLEEKLKARQYEPDQIKLLLDELKDEGLFREHAYAHARTRQLLKRGLGQSLVKARLRSEGIAISKEDIDNAFDHMGSQPLDELRILFQKTLRRWQRRTELTEKQCRDRVLQSLARKGHSITDILKLFKEESQA